MREIGVILIGILALLSTACEQCLEGDLIAPASLFVALVDETTQENVFESLAFSAAQISVKDAENQTVPFNFIATSNLIQLFPSTQNTTGNTLVITVANEATSITKEVTLMYEVSAKKEACYTVYTIENVQVLNAISERVEGIYVIKI